MSWPNASISELCSRVTSGGTPRRSNSDYYVTEGIPWVKTQELNDNRLEDTSEHISQSAIEESSAKLLPGGAILVAMYGATAGKLGVLGRPMACNQACCALIVNPSVADSRFLFYALLNSREQLKGLANGAAQQNLSARVIKEFRISNPPVEAQRRIGNLLGALDDKIAVNERIAATSLELGVALYRQKSTFAEWRSLPLGSAARWHSGGTPKTSIPEYWNGDIPWISAASLKSPWIRDSDRSVTKLGARNGTRIAAPNSILFVVRGMSLKNEFRVGIAQREITFGQDCKALVANPGIDSTTLFLAVKSRAQEILQMVDLAGHGTGRLATDRLAALTVKLPPEGLATSKFAEVVHPLIDRASRADLECKSLADLRDTLLPQLMSGRLRVKDAEKIAEDHT
ncbi:restriction endonuclease subunit S [Streptomyces sp. NPDC046759]|uniref:restriction endonuclease subunit S n=1 Tax=Streptomyces sp. NPDC046759 TaxID=3155019 RepID=UPI0033FE554D